MSESEEDKTKRLLKELEGKNIAYYSVLLTAWIQTKMELDKTLVTLSSAAIGLLITILITIGVQNVYEIILFIISICAFSVTILNALFIYKLNAKYIERAMRGSSETDPALEKYDKFSIYTFFIGVCFAVFFALFIGITSAYQKIIFKENKMLNEEKNTSKMVMVNDSINGIAALNPQNIEKSLNGVGNLKPETVQKPEIMISQPQVQNTTISDNNSSDSKKSN